MDCEGTEVVVEGRNNVPNQLTQSNNARVKMFGNTLVGYLATGKMQLGTSITWGPQVI